MSAKLSRAIMVSWLVALGGLVTPSLAQEALSGTEPAQPDAPLPGLATTGPGVDEAAISAAQQYLRQGVALYNRHLYSEALGEFNRALALDPMLEEARKYREKCNGKLQLSAMGVDPGAIPQFETFDPESVISDEETSQLSPEEVRIERIRRLMKEADLYLEHKRFATAARIYEEILLIAPENVRARAGLHKATLGLHEEQIRESEQRVEEDRTIIRQYTEDAKRLPEGAGPTGIKKHRITVPIVEEEYVAPTKRSEIEEILESPVSLMYEEEHINEIVEFIADTYGINIVVDERAVPRPTEAAVPPGGAAPGSGAYPGMAGAYPGMSAGSYPGGGGLAGRPGGTQGGMFGQGAAGRPSGFGVTSQPGSQLGAAGGYAQYDAIDVYQTDGIIKYINVKNVTLREALKALLRPLNLSFSVQERFIWISSPKRIRLETFEELETRYFELRHAGAETLF